MAKTLRLILCPQCGSPANTTLGPNLYRCNACQTEHYLDSDDVTVHARHRYAAPPPRSVPAPTTARYPRGFVIGHDQTTYTLSLTGKLGPAITAH
jgi:DNA-directed RNA polymerase subunit RPC12/RpoP